MKKLNSYDPACFQIAKAFLEDAGFEGELSAHVDALAAQIQETVEDYIAFQKEAPDGTVG